MERQLELKHLANYLHYGVNIIFNNEIKGILCGVSTGIMDLEVIEDYDNNTPIIKKWCSLDTKLILHPLSDLTKEIVYNGKKFVPITEIKNLEIYSHFELDSFIKNNFTVGHIESLSYQLINILLEWHFDVFGLIDKGLAISYEEAGL